MTQFRKRRSYPRTGRAVWITLIYAALASLWIYASDALLELIITDASLFAAASTYKGWVFVAVTSVLLYSLLRTAPRPSAELADESVGFRIWPPLLIFGVFVLLVGATGYLVYRGIEQGVRKRAEETLGAVADLKTQQVADWLSERRGNAERASVSPFMAPESEAWLARGAPADETAARLTKRLEGLMTTHRWSSVFLVDRQGEVKIDLRKGKGDYTASRELALRAMESRQVVWRDFHRNTDGEIALAFFAPLLVQDGDGGRAVAAIVMELDPSARLYPLVATWPLPARTGESLLVRQDGDSVLYLTNVRHVRRSAVALRQLTSANYVASKALAGVTGPIRGLDYRGVPVVAC
ncbi:MAG: hypothetical protein WA208_04005, partial [Thermoanaerobaculia bacterium]